METNAGIESDVNLKFKTNVKSLILASMTQPEATVNKHKLSVIGPKRKSDKEWKKNLKKYSKGLIIKAIK